QNYLLLITYYLLLITYCVSRRRSSVVRRQSRGIVIIPSCNASVVASSLLCTPIFLMTFWIWVRTVLGLSTKISLIASLLLPLANCSSISISRADRRALSCSACCSRCCWR